MKLDLLHPLFFIRSVQKIAISVQIVAISINWILLDLLHANIVFELPLILALHIFFTLNLVKSSQILLNPFNLRRAIIHIVDVVKWFILHAQFLQVHCLRILPLLFVGV